MTTGCHYPIKGKTIEELIQAMAVVDWVAILETHIWVASYQSDAFHHRDHLIVTFLRPALSREQSGWLLSATGNIPTETALRSKNSTSCSFHVSREPCGKDLCQGRPHDHRKMGQAHDGREYQRHPPTTMRK